MLRTCSHRSVAPLRSFATAAPSSVAYSRKGDQPAVAPLAVKAVSNVSGFHVASLDSKGPVSSLAIVARAGSRFEGPSTPGLAHVLKRTFLRTLPEDNVVRNVMEAELRGNALYTAHSREQVVLGAHFLRDDLVDVLPLLLKYAYNPSFHSYELLRARGAVLSETAGALADPSIASSEALHRVAFRSGLGNPLFAQSTGIKSVKRSDIKAYTDAFFTPDRVAIVATGVLHEDLTQVLGEALSGLQVPSGSAKATATASRYYGGEARIEAGPKSQSLFTVAYPSPAFTSPDYAASRVLEALLDGHPHTSWGSIGGSTGLLSKASTASTSSKAFVLPYSDAGLLGFQVHGAASEVKGVAQKSIAALKSIASGVSDAALARAKKQAIINVETTGYLSTRYGRLESMAAHVFATKAFSTSSDAAVALGKVSAADLSKVAKTVLAGKPSVVAYGNLNALPYADEL